MFRVVNPIFMAFYGVRCLDSRARLALWLKSGPFFNYVVRFRQDTTTVPISYYYPAKDFKIVF